MIKPPLTWCRALEEEYRALYGVEPFDGTAATVLVGGDAGIGKSRLIAEFSVHARGQGALVLEGGCVSLGGFR